MPGLVVTFVGLPGTGKSTLLARVLEILRERGTTCDASDEVAYRKMMNKLAWTVREACGHPRFAWRSLKALVASRQRSFMDLLKMVSNWFARAFLIRRAARSPGIHLIDEDMFQVLWSIGFSSRLGAWPAGFPLPGGTFVPVPSLVVVLESSLEVIERRLAARPGCSSRLEKWLPEEPGVLQRAECLMERVKDTIAHIADQQAAMHVLLIDSDRNDRLEANALGVVDCIDALRDDSGMPMASHQSIDGVCHTVLMTAPARS